MSRIKFKLYELWLIIQFFFLRTFPIIFKYVDQQNILLNKFPNFIRYVDFAWNYYNGNLYCMLEKWYKYNNTSISNWIEAIKIVQKFLDIRSCEGCKNLIQEVILNNVESFVVYHYMDLCSIITYFPSYANKEQIDDLIILFTTEDISWLEEFEQMYTNLYEYCNEQQRKTLEMLTKIKL